MIDIDWQQLLAQYGYLAILLGTFLEGESILVMGGYAAHQGYLSLPHVLVAAFVGSFFGDQLYFVIGRLHGRAFLARRPTWRARVDRVNGLLQRYQTAYILGFRFLYGLRTLSPFVLGAGSVKTSQFVLLNAVGAVLWTFTVGFLGFAFGEMVTLMLGRAKHYEAYVLGAIFVVGVTVTIILHRRAKHRGQPLTSPGPRPGPPPYVPPPTG